MLRKDLKMMAGRHLWPPSCRAVGAARSPSLMVGKERCLPSHHHHHQLDPSPQIKIPSFLGSGMMGRELKAAGRHIGSPSCGNIPKRQGGTGDNGGSPSVGAPSPSDGGGFPPAGLLVPVSRPDPRLHQQRRPLLAAAGSLPSPAGYCSAPATPPRCCGGAIRHALVAGGFFPSTGLQNAAPAKLKVPSSRLFSTITPAEEDLSSTIPPPMPSDVDLLKVDKIWAVGDKYLYNIELVAKKISESPIKGINGADILASLKLAIEACKSYQDRQKELKKFYDEKLRPALVVRGLVSRYSLSDKQGIAVHNEFKRIAKYSPKYITSLEVTVELTSMTESFWTRCFDFLSEQRCIVIEDWDKPLGVSIGSFLFDRTVAFDGSKVYRGESDAAHYHKDETAMACSAVWSPESEVLSTILVKEFACKTSNMAEVISMYVLLKEAIKLHLHKFFFQGSSDSSLVYKILSGHLVIDPNDDSEPAKLNRLLKDIRKYFDKLLPKWKNREKMFFVDGIMREFKRQNALANEEVFDIGSLIHKAAYCIAGSPVFTLVQNSSFINRLDKKKSSPLDLQFEDCCYVEVDENYKADAIWHITSSLRPGIVEVIMFDLESRVDFAKYIKYLFGDYVNRADKEGYSLFTIDAKDLRFPTASNRRASNKTLLILFDAMIPQQESQDVFQIPDTFTVVLTTPSERSYSSKLHEFSPLSFVSFHEGSSKKNGGANGNENGNGSNQAQ